MIVSRTNVEIYYTDAKIIDPFSPSNFVGTTVCKGASSTAFFSLIGLAQHWLLQLQLPSGVRAKSRTLPLQVSKCSCARWENHVESDSPQLEEEECEDQTMIVWISISV